MTADPDFDWVAKWTQVVPVLAQVFNFLMVTTVRAAASNATDVAQRTRLCPLSHGLWHLSLFSFPVYLRVSLRATYGTQACVGLLSWTCYTAVGLAFMPVDILKGQKHIDRLQSTIEERESLLGNRYAQIREKAWRQGVGSLSRRERRDAEVSEQSRWVCVLTVCYLHKHTRTHMMTNCHGTRVQDCDLCI